jgi:folate-binding protein YgfZ
MDIEIYNKIRTGATGFYRQKRGLIAVWGKESVQFLNGLITNDVAKLDDGEQFLAAFPNAQGRLIAVVRVLRQGERFLFETEEITREKVYNNLFKFTFAGDFFVEDLSENYSFYSIFNGKWKTENDLILNFGEDIFVSNKVKMDFSEEFEISDDLYEILRIEKGIPLYGVDMDETTIVPEIGIENLISYNKGCYIGQEIIARIHFRGHVAKQLRGLILADEGRMEKGEGREVETSELKTVEGKNAGKITSVCYSPKLEKNIALGFVRYDYLAEGTELRIGERTATVKNLPFIS